MGGTVLNEAHLSISHISNVNSCYCMYRVWTLYNTQCLSQHVFQKNTQECSQTQSKKKILTLHVVGVGTGSYDEDSALPS